VDFNKGAKKSRNDRAETKFVPSVAGYILYDHGTNEEVRE